MKIYVIVKRLKIYSEKIFFSQSDKGTLLSTFYYIYLVIFITVFCNIYGQPLKVCFLFGPIEKH